MGDLFAGAAALLGSSARSARAHEWRIDGVVSSKSRRAGKVFVRVLWEDLERKEFGKKLTKRERKKANAIKQTFKKIRPLDGLPSGLPRHAFKNALLEPHTSYKSLKAHEEQAQS